MVNYHKTWRFINAGPGSASYNMALDEAIAISVRKGSSAPVLRLYSWDRPSVTLGCFQKISDIDTEYCRDASIPVVRRPTGGRAILHNKELTYSFSVKTDNDLFSKGIFDSYKKISAALYLALSKLGLSPEVSTKRKSADSSLRTQDCFSPLCFQSASYGEITINSKKVIGSAQKRWTDGLLQQGSIPYHIDELKTLEIFRLHSIRDIKDAMAGLTEAVPDLSDEKFRNIVKVSFEEVFNIEFFSARPSNEEEFLAQKLDSEKYRTEEWNFQK
ncbi:MAG: biotin/lipoate A/B protein ligase family protein [Thermodesulfovibrionales bacterium]|nr:biotin/lipoate A/B protein ligase family protein [Thermodesulfovibrionales bacterium]